MICVSVGTGDAKSVRRLVEGLDMAEIRLDLIRLTPNDIRELFSLSKTLIATCHPGRFAPAERERLLKEAVRSGAAYVDIELDAPERLRSAVIREAGLSNCRLIVSHHDYLRTPSPTILEKKMRLCFEAGAHVAKIACRVRKTADVLNLLSLYAHKPPKGRFVLALGLGDLGTITRIAAPFLGAPFTFASPDSGRPTADGQLNKTSMEKILDLLRGEKS